MDSYISPGARIGENVTFGHGTKIYDGVEIGDNTSIGDFCSIGVPTNVKAPLVIGAGSTIRSHNIFYRGSVLGPNLETGHHVLIRDGAQFGTNVRVGTFCAIEGDCHLGDYAICHGNVQVGRGSRVGKFVWLFSQVILTNDPLPPSRIFKPTEIGDGAVVCVNCTVLAGARMGRGSFATARTTVSGDIPPSMIVSGQDSEVRGHVATLIDFESGTRHPWMLHFKDYYPREAWDQITELGNAIKNTRR